MALEPARTETLKALSDGRRWVDVRESVTRNGIEYSRSGYVIDGKVSEDINTHHFICSTMESEPHVLCGKCQGDAFRLGYGHYEISAECVACGFEAVVYDG